VSRERAAFAALLLGAAAIGLAPILVRLSELGPVATAFWRLALALPVLAAWVAWDRRVHAPRPVRHVRAWMLLAGILFAADLAAWHWSIRYTAVANATLLANLAPLVVTAGAWLWLGERVTRRFLAGLLLGLCGAGLLMAHSLELSASALAGDALGLLTAVFYGGYLLTVSRVRRQAGTATVMAWTGVTSAVLLLLMCLLTGEPLGGISVRGWLVLLALAGISHVGGQGLITYALAHLNASFSSLSLLLQPLVAAVLAWWLLAEPLHGLQWIGGAVVLAAIYLARPLRR